jgi:hydroxyethylthiazole kinase-like uncharacterized protein yjeF
MATPRPRDIATDLLGELPLPSYAPEASKADRGKLLIVAGSSRLPGAAILAARAALRVGCGTVRVAAPSSVATLIGVAVPELMVLPLAETAAGTASRAALDEVRAQYEACDAAVIGPGLGDHEETEALTRQVVAEAPLPLLVDAEALLTLARDGRAADFGTARGPRLLTPHPGEMAQLTGRDVEEIEADRDAAAVDFARRNRLILVLKGSETLIAAPSGESIDLYRNTAGTHGLGTAGSGDVLAGAIGGLLAQPSGATAAAVWGVHLHALAGEAATADLGDDGMMAGDVVDRLPRALRHLRAEPMSLGP